MATPSRQYVARDNSWILLGKLARIRYGSNAQPNPQLGRFVSASNHPETSHLKVCFISRKDSPVALRVDRAKRVATIVFWHTEFGYAGNQADDEDDEEDVHF
ncbi:hypothetical protein [Burkholderia multivorans]|uniref:hypothetical protein n=1 Tax=Burkholderia multivorans TaxID=87883 RepID=UPI0021C22DB9|nr:hypothetical protein [Burkholderia multivorans]UXZ65401.1 hypothetical protein NUJ28_29575 [Burkholderia multivorans]HDR8910607.1 hypothetical protein [Burkholderia multivorans]